MFYLQASYNKIFYSIFFQKPLPIPTQVSTLKGRSSTVTTNSSSGYNSMVTLDPAANNFRYINKNVFKSLN